LLFGVFSSDFQVLACCLPANSEFKKGKLGVAHSFQCAKSNEFQPVHLWQKEPQAVFWGYYQLLPPGVVLSTKNHPA
jgi:hypothetical protein